MSRDFRLSRDFPTESVKNRLSRDLPTEAVQIDSVGILHSLKIVGTRKKSDMNAFRAICGRNLLI